MKPMKTATNAQGQRASSGIGEAFWRRASSRTTCGLIAVAALTLVGPAHTIAAPAQENGPVAEALGTIGSLANQVAAANSELANLNAQLGSQREAVNKSIVDLQRARATADAAAKAVAAAQKALTWAGDKIVSAQKAFDSQAALAYTKGSAGGGVASYLSASNPEQLLQRGQALALVSEAQNMSLDTLVRARDEQTKRLEAAEAKQQEADAAKAEAAQRKTEALNAIAAVQQAAAAQNAKIQSIEARRNEAVADLQFAKANESADVQAATTPATGVAGESSEPAAQAAETATTTAAPAVEAAAPAATTAPTATAGASDWVQLLLELINTGSADSGSSTGSGDTGSLGGDAELPPPVDGATEEPPTEDAAADIPPTEEPAAEEPAAEPETPLEETPVEETPAAETPDDSEYYEGDDEVIPVETGGGSGSVGAPDITGSAGVETVVQRAMSQLGVMYSWGGGDENGPTLGIRDGGTADRYGDYKTVGFDCSGLMVYAFAGVGISLPHYSGYQYTAGTQIPIANVQRGDMIFWGPGGSQHVALYLGDGMMIEAMQSGTPIHVTEVRYGGIQPYAVRLIE